jgi:predicted ArsR family transcriptional regulator
MSVAGSRFRAPAHGGSLGEPRDHGDMMLSITGLDDTVHQRVRLGIPAVVAEADMAEFTYLRDRLDVTDGNLNRHLRVLTDAGFVAIEKRAKGRKRTWVRSTDSGRQALRDHLGLLQDIIDATKGFR